MIELPEAKALAKQGKKLLVGHTIIKAMIGHSPHKFCFFNVESDLMKQELEGKTIIDVTSCAHYLRLLFNDGSELYAAEDYLIEYKPLTQQGDKHQICLILDNDQVIEIRVKMYAFFGVGLMDKLIEEWPYYRVAIRAIDPLSAQFTFDYFMETTKMNKRSGTIKQALATNQTIPGLGNGVLQDILFNAGLLAKRKVNTLSDEDLHRLYDAVVTTLHEMTNLSGRSNTILLNQQPGGYQVLMDAKANECPRCHGLIVKEAYLGGKVTYCPTCQK